MTPFELSLRIEGYTEEREEHIQELIYLAWHIEALSRQKRLPQLKKILKVNSNKKKADVISYEHLIELAKLKGLKVPQKWR